MAGRSGEASGGSISAPHSFFYGGVTAGFTKVNTVSVDRIYNNDILNEHKSFGIKSNDRPNIFIKDYNKNYCNNTYIINKLINNYNGNINRHNNMDNICDIISYNSHNNSYCINNTNNINFNINNNNNDNINDNNRGDQINNNISNLKYNKNKRAAGINPSSPSSNKVINLSSFVFPLLFLKFWAKV